MTNPFFYPMQIFKKINTGCTMHLRQFKQNIYAGVAPEARQLVYHRLVVQVSKISGNKFSSGFDPGIFIKAVIRAKIILVEQ